MYVLDDALASLTRYLHVYIIYKCHQRCFSFTRSKEEKIERLQFDLEEVEKREIESQLHLANMVRLAEKASTERATFAAVAEQEQRTSQHALRQTMREKWEMGRMEESLKV